MADSLRTAEEGESTIFTIRYAEYPAACIFDPFQSSISGAQAANVPEVLSIPDRDFRSKNQLCSFPRNQTKKLIELVRSYFDGLAERTGGRSYEIGRSRT